MFRALRVAWLCSSRLSLERGVEGLTLEVRLPVYTILGSEVDGLRLLGVAPTRHLVIKLCALSLFSNV